VAREIDANVSRSLTRGTEDLWKRLREVVSHMWPFERAGVPLPRHNGHECLRPGGTAARLNVNGDARSSTVSPSRSDNGCAALRRRISRSTTCCALATANDARRSLPRSTAFCGSRSQRAEEAPDTPTVDDILTVCLRTWRCQRRHETRDTSIHSHSEGADYFIARSSVFSDRFLFRLKGREHKIDSNHGDRWRIALLNPEFVDTLNSATLAGCLLTRSCTPRSSIMYGVPGAIQSGGMRRVITPSIRCCSTLASVCRMAFLWITVSVE